MATHHFGTEINPALYVELADPDNPGQVIRPGAGAEIQVRDALTQDALASVESKDYGYLEITTTDVPAIEISAEPEVWIGPFWSREATESMHSAGINSADALSVAQEALLTAQDALTRVGVGGGGSGPEVIIEVSGSPGTYPAPATAGARWFFGAHEPTTDQGFRGLEYGDMWWPVVRS